MPETGRQRKEKERNSTTLPMGTRNDHGQNHRSVETDSTGAADGDRGRQMDDGSINTQLQHARKHNRSSAPFQFDCRAIFPTIESSPTRKPPGKQIPWQTQSISSCPANPVQSASFSPRASRPHWRMSSAPTTVARSPRSPTWWTCSAKAARSKTQPARWPRRKIRTYCCKKICGHKKNPPRRGFSCNRGNNAMLIRRHRKAAQIKHLGIAFIPQVIEVDAHHRRGQHARPQTRRDGPILEDGAVVLPRADARPWIRGIVVRRDQNRLGAPGPLELAHVEAVERRKDRVAVLRCRNPCQRSLQAFGDDHELRACRVHRDDLTAELVHGGRHDLLDLLRRHRGLLAVGRDVGPVDRQDGIGREGIDHIADDGSPVRHAAAQVLVHMLEVWMVPERLRQPAQFQATHALAQVLPGRCLCGDWLAARAHPVKTLARLFDGLGRLLASRHELPWRLAVCRIAMDDLPDPPCSLGIVDSIDQRHQTNTIASAAIADPGAATVLVVEAETGRAGLLDRARAAPLRIFNQTRFNAQMGKHVLPIDSRKINFALHRFLPYSGVEKPPVNACPWDQRTHGQALSGLNCKSSFQEKTWSFESRTGYRRRNLRDCHSGTNA